MKEHLHGLTKQENNLKTALDFVLFDDHRLSVIQSLRYWGSCNLALFPEMKCSS